MVILTSPFAITSYKLQFSMTFKLHFSYTVRNIEPNSNFLEFEIPIVQDHYLYQGFTHQESIDPWYRPKLWPQTSEKSNDIMKII